MVRTPVGYKCPTCVGNLQAPGRRIPALFALAAGAAVVVAVAVGATVLRSGPERGSDPVEQGPPGEAPSTRQAMIGEEARDGQFTFVVEDFSCHPKEPQPASAPGKLCELRMTVKNTSNTPATFLGRFQYLVDGQSKTYGADEGLTRAIPANGNRSLSEMNINPDVMVPWTLVYDIPDAVQPVEAKFRGTGRSRFGISVRLERRGQ